MSNLDFLTRCTMPLRRKACLSEESQTIAANPPFISGNNGGINSSVEGLAGAQPLVTDGSIPWLISSTLSNGLILDNTAVTPGEFQVTVDGIYKVMLSAFTSISSVGIPGLIASYQDIYTLNGTILANDGITMTQTAAGIPVSGYLNDVHGERYIRLNAGDTVNLSVTMNTSNILSRNFGATDFAIQWIAP